MFGEIPPTQINAAVPFIKYSCNTVCLASRPRIFSFPFFLSVFSLHCSALFWLSSPHWQRTEARWGIWHQTFISLSVSQHCLLPQHLLNCVPYMLSPAHCFTPPLDILYSFLYFLSFHFILSQSTRKLHLSRSIALETVYLQSLHKWVKRSSF